MTATVRHYEDRDLEACRKLWVELTEWHRRIYESPGIGGSDPGQQFDALLRQTGRERIWVADLSGRVVGMAGLLVRDSEAELEPIVVAEGLRGRGVGRRLAEAVIAAAKAAGARQLLTRPVARNALAIQFFHTLGFDVLGQVELVMDLSSSAQGWRRGERLAGKSFRV